MTDSIFTKIIKGELPSLKIYEDKSTIAIIPLHPLALAHVLVIPKTQVEQFFELPDNQYHDLMNTVKKVSKRINEVYKPKRIGVKVVGIDVDHAHVHVLAFDTMEQYNENEVMDAPVNDNLRSEMAKKLAF